MKRFTIYAYSVRHLVEIAGKWCDLCGLAILLAQQELNEKKKQQNFETDEWWSCAARATEMFLFIFGTSFWNSGAICRPQTTTSVR